MDPKLPPLPLDLDNTPSHLLLPIRAGELVRLLHQWGREVYAAGQAPTDQPSAGPEDARPLLVRAREALDYCVKALSSLGISETSRRFALQNACEVIADIDQPSAATSASDAK